MKKRLFAVLLSVIMVLTLFSVVAFAESETLHEDFDDIDEGTIRTKELYLSLPEEYELDSWFEGEHLTYSNYDADYIYIVCQKNDCAPEGINALTQEEATKISMDYYDEINSDGVFGNGKSTFEVATAQKKKYNGVTGYGLSGVISYDAYDSDEPYYYAIESYLFATKESIYVIIFEDNTEIFREQEDVKATLDTIAINGTYFNGEKTTLDRDFANAPDFKTAVKLTLQQDFYGDDDDLFGYGMVYSVIRFAIVAILILCVIGAIVALAVLNYTKSKKLQAYERLYGPLNYVTTPVYVPAQPNGATPAPPAEQPPVPPQQSNMPAPPPMPQGDNAAPSAPAVPEQPQPTPTPTEPSVDENNQE
jgi:hypothetical protein